MATARNHLMSLDATPFYHCISRCVRRAFLCGEDHQSGRCFDHRKAWVVERLTTLAALFAVDVCAYAVMSNHYHVVVRVRREEALAMSDAEVIKRWKSLFHTAGEAANEAVIMAAQVQIWRERLMDVSWFMRCLNESIARQANLEDGCKGRFWEGRFKSQALLDEAAVLTCMAYVDLNPIRAGLAETPEASDFTSIQARIVAFQAAESKEETTNQAPGIAPLGPTDDNINTGLDITLSDYFELVDWTGRAIRDDKRGAIPQHLQAITERLQINPMNWVKGVEFFREHYSHLAGAPENIRSACQSLGRCWGKGVAGKHGLYRCSGDRAA